MHDRSKRPSRQGFLGGSVVTCLLLHFCAQHSSGQPDLTVRAISHELGLFDVVASQTGPGDKIVEVLDSSQRVRMRVPLQGPEGLPVDRASLQAPGPPTLHARIMLDDAIPQELREGLSIRIGTSGVPHPLNLNMEPNLAAPSWALGTTWYQIFPERFRNGDASNDPSSPEVTTVPWGSDFSDVTIEEVERAWSRQRAGDRRTSGSWNRPGGSRRATIYSRRYGGDLQGVMQELDHIKSIGVNAIYFCPIFASASLHKYDARDFRHVDPTFGPSTPIPEQEDTWEWTAADRYFLETFLPAARERGLRVILDGVWNHTGTDFWAFRDLIANGKDSPYAPWFKARFGDNGQLLGWDAWDARNGNLPEFIQTPEGDLTPEVSEHIFKITSRWMDPNGDGDPSDGIDGWRLDVAPEIGTAFWNRWRAHVRSINPDALLIGEIWFDAEPWFNGIAFDAQMNYPFASAVVEWVAGAPRTSSQALASRLQRVYSHAPHTELAQMNLLGSHDTTRLLTMISRPNATYDDGATMVDLGRDAARLRPAEEIARRAILAAAIQATALGSPMIYAGDELGVFGPDDPDNRKPVPWPDLPPPQNPDDAPDRQMRDAYRYWFSMRNKPELSRLLRYGTIRFLDSPNPDVLAFTRELNDEQVLVVVNRSDSEFDGASLDGAFMLDSTAARVPPITARLFHPSQPTTPSP